MVILIPLLREGASRKVYMIQFRVIPVEEGDEDNFLVKNDNSFLSFDFDKGTDHRKFLIKKLREEFNIEFFISRSFLVLDSDNGLIIYTYVLPRKGFVRAGYKWVKDTDLNPEDFNEYDKVAVNATRSNFED